MKCPNCGYEISDNDMICRGCGQSVVMLKQKYNIKDGVKKEPNQTSLLEIAGISKEEITNIDKAPVYEVTTKEPEIPEKYLETYIGPGYNYFKKNTFSFWSLLLGPLYWSYRGYLYQSVILTAIFSSLLVLSLFYASPLIIIVLYLIVCIYMAFTFKKQYLKKCKIQINSLLKVSKDDESKLLTTLKEQGNPSYFGPVLLVIVLFLAMFVVRLILSLLYNLI